MLYRFAETGMQLAQGVETACACWEIVGQRTKKAVTQVSATLGMHTGASTKSGALKGEKMVANIYFIRLQKQDTMRSLDAV